MKKKKYIDLLLREIQGKKTPDSSLLLKKISLLQQHFFCKQTRKNVMGVKFDDTSLLFQVEILIHFPKTL